MDHTLYMPQEDDKLKGQPWYMSVHPKDLVKSLGFKTVQELILREEW